MCICAMGNYDAVGKGAAQTTNGMAKVRNLLK